MEITVQSMNKIQTRYRKAQNGVSLGGTEAEEVRRRNSISAEDSGEVARFQHFFHYLSWLTSGRTSGHQKLVPKIPKDRQLPYGDKSHISGKPPGQGP